MARAQSSPRGTSHAGKRKSLSKKVQSPKKKAKTSIEPDQSKSKVNRSTPMISLQDTLRRLRDSKEDLEERINIAFHLYENAEQWESISKDLIHLQLIQWLSFNIAGTFKNKKKEPFYLHPKVWELLYELESMSLSPLLGDNVQEETNISQETKLPPQLLLALGDFLSHMCESKPDSSWLLDIPLVSKISKLLLGLQWFRPALTIEQFAKFIFKLLEVMRNPTYQYVLKAKEFFHFLGFVLEQFTLSLRQHSNHKKVFVAVTTRLFTELLDVSCLITEAGKEVALKHPQWTDVTHSLVTKIRNCISSVLFRSTDCAHYGNDKQLVSYHHQFYTLLETSCKAHNSSIKYLPTLLEDFIIEHRKQTEFATSQMNFYEADFFHHLFSILIRCIENTNNTANTMSDDTTPDVDGLFQISSALLHVVVKYTVNIPFKSEMDDLFTKFMEISIASFSEGMHSAQWDSFTQLLKIQHQTVFIHLDATLLPLLFAYSLEDSQMNFLIGLMELYSKLHQSPTFLVSLFSRFASFKPSAFLALHSYTPFWIAYAEFSSALSPHQEFEKIWKIFTEHWKPVAMSTSLPLCNLLGQFFSIYLDQIKLTENNAQRVTELIQVTCTGIIRPVLTRVGIFHSSSSSTSKKSKKVTATKEDALFLVSVLHLYSALCTLHNHCESLLFKSYHSNILQTGFLTPDSYFRLLGNEEEPVNAVHVLELAQLCNKEMKSYPTVLFSITLIAYQRIYDLHSCSVSLITEISAELQQLTSFIIKNSMACWNNSSSKFFKEEWNRNPFQLSQKNIGVALFSLLSQNLFYICNYIAEDDMKKLLHFLFSAEALKEAFSPLPSTSPSGSSSVCAGFLLRKLFENDQFYELHPIREHTATTLASLISVEVQSMLSFAPNGSLISFIQHIDHNTSLKNFQDLLQSKSYAADWKAALHSPRSSDEHTTNILYILTFIGSFPTYYLSVEHWSILVPFLFFTEEIYNVEISMGRISCLSDTQFHVLCECRRSMVASLFQENVLSILPFFSLCLEPLFTHTCPLLHIMTERQKKIFSSLTRRLFRAVSTSELQRSLQVVKEESKDSEQLCASTKAIFHSYSSSKKFLSANDQCTVRELLCDYLTEWLCAMRHIVLIKQAENAQGNKEALRLKKTRKIQEDALKRIDSRMEEPEEKEEQEPEEKIDTKPTKTFFSIPVSWKGLELEIYQQLVHISTDDSLENAWFLGKSLEAFSVLLEFHRTWYLPDFDPSLALTKSAGLHGVIQLFSVSNEIVRHISGFSSIPVASDSMAASIDDIPFVHSLLSLWNGVKEKKEVIESSMLLRQALRFIRAVSGSLHLPFCTHVGEADILHMEEIVHQLLIQEYLTFREERAATFFDEIDQPMTPGASSSLIDEILEVYSLLVTSCTQQHLRCLVERLETRLQSSEPFSAPVGILCLYQLLSRTKSKKRGKIISKRGLPLLLQTFHVLMTQKEDLCVARWTLELFHIIISGREYFQFTDNVVAILLGYFPRLTTVGETVASEHAHAAIANPLDIDSSMFMKLCRFLGDCLLHRFNECARSLPAFSFSVRLLLSTLGSMCHLHLHNSTSQIEGKEIQLIACIRAFSRLLEDIGTKAQATRFFVPGLLIDIIYILEHCSISLQQRSELHPGIFKLLDVAHDKDRKHVFVLLDNTGKLIFKELFERYDRDFKFTGKT